GRVLEAADVGAGHSRVVVAGRRGDQHGEKAAEQDLSLDGAEAAGGAGDRDRVDVDEERGSGRDPNRDQGDPVAQVGGPEPLQATPGSGTRRRAGERGTPAPWG